MADQGTERQRTPGRRRDDVAALLLILLGVAGLALTAWLVDPRAGFAVASASLVAGGVVLGLDR